VDSELSARLTDLESLLTQVLKELRGRKTRGAKRSRSVAERATERAELRYKPTELQIAAAKRALARK